MDTKGQTMNPKIEIRIEVADSVNRQVTRDAISLLRLLADTLEEAGGMDDLHGGGYDIQIGDRAALNATLSIGGMVV